MNEFVELFMNNEPLSRRDFLKAAGIFVGGAALAACTPKNASAPTYVPTEIPKTAEPESPKEKLKPFGKSVIGASGAGTIREFNEVKNPDKAIIDNVSKLAYENLPGVVNNSVRVHWYDMVGDDGTKPFCLVTVKSTKDQKDYNFAAFWEDEKGITRPPEDGKVYAFFPLVEKQVQNGKFSGIPDITNTTMEEPGLFYIPNLPVPQVFFIPPYTDDDPSQRDGYGIKSAMVAPIVPEFPAIPQEVLDKLPNKWNRTRDTNDNTWYIVDQTSTDKNIWRFSEENKKWQERHDVTVGEKTYEGWIVGSGNKDVQNGDIAPLEMIRTKNIPEFDVTSTDLIDGYLTDYKIVEVKDSTGKANIAYFTLRYFRKDGSKIDVVFSADNESLRNAPGYSFEVDKSLGKKYNIHLLSPNGNSFSTNTIDTFASNTKTPEGIRKEIKYRNSNEWKKINSLVSDIKNPAITKLDLAHKILVSYLTSKPIF